MQADLLNLEERVGSGRLPTHIFLLESLSSPRDQVLKYFKLCLTLFLFQTSKSKDLDEKVSEEAMALQANLAALASRGSVSAR